MSAFWDELKKIPPVTRTIVLSTVGLTVPSIILKLVNPYLLLFNYKLVTEKFQIWRLYTSFFIAGSGINFIFDIAMLYRNSNALEEGNYPRRSADYAWHLLLSAVSIIVLNIPLKSSVHFRPLFIAMTTVQSLINPEAMTSLFGMVSFPQKWFPLVLLGLDTLQGGTPAAALATTGLITGYAWWLLEWRESPGSPPPGSGRVIGRAPEWLKYLVGDQSVAPIPPVAGGVNVQAPRGRALNDGGRGAAAPEPAYVWGRGNRLGTS